MFRWLYGKVPAVAGHSEIGGLVHPFEVDGGNAGEQEMPRAVIEDMDQFNAFLAAQPFCAWLAQKQQELAMGMLSHKGRPVADSKAAKDDNADLLAALSSMA